MVSRHLRHAVGVREEIVYLGNFQGVPDALIHACQRDRMASFLMAHVGPDQSAHSGGINIRDSREVEHKARSTVTTNQILKLVKRGNGQWSGKPENASVVLQPKVFDG